MSLGHKTNFGEGQEGNSNFVPCFLPGFVDHLAASVDMALRPY
jgi:hypothetical protein